MIATMLAHSTARSRIIPICTIGSGTFSSTQTQSTSTTIDRANTPSVVALSQPQVSPSLRAISSAESPTDIVRAPHQSTREGVRTRDSGSRNQTGARHRMTGAAPNQKSHSHEKLSSTTPLSTSPMPAPMPRVAESRPSAMPTFSGGSSSRTMPNASGKIAPAAPCSARARISIAIDVDSAAPIVPTAKITITINSRRFLP